MHFAIIAFALGIWLQQQAPSLLPLSWLALAALPAAAVREVTRALPLAFIPGAPAGVAGVVARRSGTAKYHKQNARTVRIATVVGTKP